MISTMLRQFYPKIRPKKKAIALPLGVKTDGDAIPPDSGPRSPANSKPPRKSSRCSDADYEVRLPFIKTL
jgi:hypothetical protein